MNSKQEFYWEIIYSPTFFHPVGNCVFEIITVDKIFLNVLVKKIELIFSEVSTKMWYLFFSCSEGLSIMVITAYQTV